MFRLFRFLILALALCPMAAMAQPHRHLVDINTASVPALQRVKGINATDAREIVRHRQTHGYFRSVDDLIRVRGINQRKLRTIRGQVTASRPLPPPPPRHAPPPPYHR
ncbi:MAG: helix-hairpin-helix domain-containing protein [Azoarcus sp.]|jgi:competence protein ComEA|nr:helix-hairpin-helix domain-containing protein [Azoarcus sp.]